MNLGASLKNAATVVRLRSGMIPLWSCSRYCWGSIDHWLFRYDYASETLHKSFRLPRASDHPIGRLKDWLARSKLRQLILPSASIHHLVELPNGDVIVIFDRVYWYSPSTHDRTAEVLLDTSHPPLSTPLRAGVAVHLRSGHAYFGEYHDDPAGVRVARIDASNRMVEVCWWFSRSEIRHIHAIHYDRFRNRLWICTGDRDSESSLYYTDDEFTSVHRFSGGDQTWRAIAMLFDESGMEWGMDAGKDAPADAVNRIFRYDFITGQRTEQAVIGNPAYAACEFDDGTAVMQTSFEPGRRQDTPECAALWLRYPDHTWRHCFSVAYQNQPRKGAGKYASLLIPFGVVPKGRLLFMPVNCAQGSYNLHRMSLGGEHD